MAARSFRESGNLSLKCGFSFVWWPVRHGRAPAAPSAVAFALGQLDVFKAAMGAILAIFISKSDPDVGRH